MHVWGSEIVFLSMELDGRLSISIKFVVSFDVCRLFANIPLDETIELAVDFIIDNILNINCADLKKVFSFTTSRTHFLFNGSLYDQVDCVGMRSPLAPVLVSLFMSHHEQDWLPRYGHKRPEYYRRYVYDTFCLFKMNKTRKAFLYILTFDILALRSPWKLKLKEDCLI